MTITATESKTSAITILGSGTCNLVPERSSCAFIAEVDDSLCLFDIGPNTMRQLLKAGYHINDISHIFLSHFHPDHSSELVPFLFTSKYAENQKRRTPLTIVAGPGFSDYWAALKRLYGHWIELDAGLVKRIECGSDELNSGDVGVWVRHTKVCHNPESVAFRIENQSGHSFVYSGDTDTCLPLIALADRTDCLICEASTPDGLKIKGHLTPSLAGEIAAEGQVRHLVLTHFYPSCDQVDVRKECRRTFKGKLTLARDLMRFPIA